MSNNFLNKIVGMYKQAQVAKKADEEEKYEFGHPIYNLLSEAQSAMFPEEFQDFEEYVQNNREKFYNEISIQEEIEMLHLYVKSLLSST